MVKYAPCESTPKSITVGEGTLATSIDINVDPSSGTAPFTATVSGTLKANGSPLTGVSKNIWWYYSLNNQTTWVFINLLPTDPNTGKYSGGLSFSIETQPGTYYYKVKYVGD